MKTVIIACLLVLGALNAALGLDLMLMGESLRPNLNLHAISQILVVMGLVAIVAGAYMLSFWPNVVSYGDRDRGILPNGRLRK